MHQILKHQIKKTKLMVGKGDSALASFLDAVDRTYTSYDEDYALLNRSLELSSQELEEYIQKIKENNKHLQDLDKEKSNFLNMTSHELKTPLTVIYAYLDILDDTKSSFDKAERKGLETIRRNADQLKSLITNILEVARIEAGKFELVTTEINPRKKIRQIAENLRQLAKNKGLKIKLNIGANTPLKMMTDEQRFEELFNNLISNAIKFTKKGAITLESSGDKKFFIGKVKDTGEGIPKDKVKNLFRNFYQVDSTISRKFGGTGLGLSITKKLIELQGGKIAVESNVGRGTVFTFYLPLKPKETINSRPEKSTKKGKERGVREKRRKNLEKGRNESKKVTMNTTIEIKQDINKKEESNHNKGSKLDSGRTMKQKGGKSKYS